MKEQIKEPKKPYNTSSIKIHHTDREKPYVNLFRETICKFIIKKWQESWSKGTQNKLQPTIGGWPPAYRKIREVVVLARIFIGDTHINHFFLLKNNMPSSTYL